MGGELLRCDRNMFKQPEVTSTDYHRNSEPCSKPLPSTEHSEPHRHICLCAGMHAALVACTRTKSASDPREQAAAGREQVSRLLPCRDSC